MLNLFTSRPGETVHGVSKNQPVWFGVTVLCAIGVLNVSAGFFSHDQIENILGAQELLRGQALYSQYFTSVPPLTYYVTAVIRSVIPLVLLPWVFNGLLVLWALGIRRLLVTVLDRYISWTVSVALLVSLPYVGGQTILSETFVAVSSCTALVFLLRYLAAPTQYSIIRTAVYVGLLAEACAFSYFAYVPYATFIIGFNLILILRRVEVAKRWQYIGKFLAALTVPLIIFGISLTATHAIKDFFFATYTFNRDYYTPFVTYPRTILGWFAEGAVNIPRLLWEAMQTFSFSSLKFIALIAPFGVAVVYLARRHQWWHVGLFSGTLVFLIVRIMHVKEYTSTSFAAHHHSAPLVLASLVALGYTLLLVKQHGAASTVEVRRRHTIVQLLLATFAIITLVTYFWFSLRSSMSVAQYDPVRTTTVPACMVNTLTEANGTTWVGPHMMYDVLLVQPKRSTRYTYFFPLHAACPQCKVEFLSDLERANPQVLIVNTHFGMYGRNVSQYLPELMQLLHQRYWQLNHIGAEMLYFSQILDPQVVDDAWQRCTR